MADQTLNVGVLSNPLSGGNRKGMGAIRKVVADHAHVVHYEVRTPADVLSALTDSARKGLEIIAVNGGDGTIQAVLTALFHQKPFVTLPVMAILRSGTTSMTAGDVGLKGSALTGLRKLISWSKNKNRRTVILKRPVLSVQAPGQEPLCGMFFGAVGICQGIRFFHAKVNSLGLRGELIPGLIIARFLLGAIRRRGQHVTPSSIGIAMNGNPPERRECLALMVSTLERLFLGMRPFWGTEKGPLHFSAVSSNPQHFLEVVPSVLRGKPGRLATAKNGYLSHNVDELQLTLESDFALDGELYMPERGQGPVVLRSVGQASFLRL
ncbi:MAG: hypothetical protein JRI47_03690 [Deltaproteobacteria bacterium]|nr:hypothetical protein [Deltaproteobacteria bacterium]